QEDLPLARLAFGPEISLNVNLPEVAPFLEWFQHRVIEIRLRQCGKRAIVPGGAVNKIPGAEGKAQVLPGDFRQRRQIDSIRRPRKEIDNGSAAFEIMDQRPADGGGKLVNSREDHELRAGRGELVELRRRERHRREASAGFRS